MPSQEDLNAAHRYFSSHCFNAAWELIDKTDRTPEEEEMMIHLCHASIWHWSRREDCTDRNRSIGFWQASRIYAILGRAEGARRYAELALQFSGSDDAFLRGYAYESLARAEAVCGDATKIQEYLRQAETISRQIPDAEDCHRLLADLKTVEAMK